MAINFIKKEDLSHITRTTRQWETTIDRYEIIPKGVLCIELCNDKLTKIKIGNGHLIYEQLPYVSDVNLSDYYTKEETNNLIKNLKSIKIKGEASSLSDLPLRGNEEGDLWFVDKSDPDEHSRYDEYVWYNNKWESFGSSDIDLSEYAKKSYVDTHIQEVQEEIIKIIESGYLHKHDNKDILDHTSAVYNVEKDNKLRDLHNYDDTELREKAHTHLNKNILDQTDAVYNRDKDDKLRGLHNYDDTNVKDRIFTLESIAHSHDNQEILNRITAAFTKEQALTLLDCKDFEGTDGVHDGYHGFVPAPTKDDIGKVLGANGQWVEGGGDTIAQGGGIEITTDPQTNVKTVSVKVGDNLEIDPQTGELNATCVDYEAGQGIEFITTESGDSFNVKNKEYYFTDMVSCQLNGDYGPRTFTRVSTDPCLLAIAKAPSNGTMWACLLAVGLTENSVKYSNSYDGVTVGPDDSFEYKGYTWYITWNYGLMNSSGVDLMGNVPTIDTASIDMSDRDNLYLLGQALIDTAELIQTIVSMDVWNGGIGWLNGAYNDYQSDYFWTNWYYTYHSNQNEYLEVPTGAIKMRMIGISNENDSRFQGGGVDCFNASHHHFASVGCITDEWVDIPLDTVYLQFGVKWNEQNNRYISSSDIKSVTLQFWFSDPKNNAITAKLGNGLEFDSNDAIEVKLGDGLTIDEDDAVTLDPTTVQLEINCIVVE